VNVEQFLGVVVAAVAVYGAALSTMTLRAQRRERRAVVRVKVSNGFAVSGPRLSEPQLQITATNAGERPVVLENAGFRLPTGETVMLVNPTTGSIQGFPHELPPHRSCVVVEDMAGIAGSLARAGHVGRIRLVGFYRDQESNMFSADSWDFDVNEWMRQTG